MRRATRTAARAPARRGARRDPSLGSREGAAADPGRLDGSPRPALAELRDRDDALRHLARRARGRGAPPEPAAVGAPGDRRRAAAGDPRARPPPPPEGPRPR